MLLVPDVGFAVKDGTSLRLLTFGDFMSKVISGLAILGSWHYSLCFALLALRLMVRVDLVKCTL